MLPNCNTEIYFLCFFLTGAKPFKCRYCDQAFAQLSTQTRHERTHTNEKPCMCHWCGKTYTQPSGLHGHQKRCHPEAVTKVKEEKSADAITNHEVGDGTGTEGVYSGSSATETSNTTVLTSTKQRVEDTKFNFMNIPIKSEGSSCEIVVTEKVVKVSNQPSPQPATLST